MGQGSRFTGSTAIKARLAEEAKAFRLKMAAALYVRTEAIMGDSKEHYVPVDLANLKDSGHVGKPVWRGHILRIELAYGGPSVAYALAVHEHMSTHSPPSWKGKPIVFQPSGRGPKYLERPMMAAVPTLARDMAKDLKLG